MRRGKDLEVVKFRARNAKLPGPVEKELGGPDCLPEEGGSARQLPDVEKRIVDGKIETVRRKRSGGDYEIFADHLRRNEEADSTALGFDQESHGDAVSSVTLVSCVQQDIGVQTHPRPRLNPHTFLPGSNAAFDRFAPFAARTRDVSDEN